MRYLQDSIEGLAAYLVDECRRVVCRGRVTPVEAGMPSGAGGQRMAISENQVELVLLTDFLLILNTGSGCHEQAVDTDKKSEECHDCSTSFGLFTRRVIERTGLF